VRQSLTFFIPFSDLTGGPRPSVKAGASSASLPRQRLVNLLGPTRQPLWLGEPSVRKVSLVYLFLENFRKRLKLVKFVSSKP
jgi:hypothetical protein